MGKCPEPAKGNTINLFVRVRTTRIAAIEHPVSETIHEVKAKFAKGEYEHTKLQPVAKIDGPGLYVERLPSGYRLLEVVNPEVKE